MSVNRPFNCGVSSSLFCRFRGHGFFSRSLPHGGVRRVPQRAQRRPWSASRLNEITATTIPAGHHRPCSSPAISELRRGSGRFLSPVERCAVHPDAVQDDSELPRHRHLRFLHAIPLGQPEPQTFNAHQRFVRCSSTLAASNRQARSSRSPHRETCPVMSISPD
jgi:hypothetical protein